MNFKLDTNGYMYSYSPTHILANKAGKVYEHVYVMYNHIGRKLNADECVHHIDRDRTNNNISNLLLLTFEEHTKLHWLEDHGVFRVNISCKGCGESFECLPREGRIYCSEQCFREDRKKFKISKEDLYNLVWNYPTTEVAKMLGVSDVAVSKRCKTLGITKPPRGYWRKVETGFITLGGKIETTTLQKF